jgi:hypothetical protein
MLKENIFKFYSLVNVPKQSCSSSCNNDTVIKRALTHSNAITLNSNAIDVLSDLYCQKEHKDGDT